MYPDHGRLGGSHWPSQGILSAVSPCSTAGKWSAKIILFPTDLLSRPKEAISGYFFIHAENLEQAASIAQTCPLVLSGRMSMEVRPVILFGNE